MWLSGGVAPALSYRNELSLEGILLKRLFPEELPMGGKHSTVLPTYVPQSYLRQKFRFNEWGFIKRFNFLVLRESDL